MYLDGNYVCQQDLVPALTTRTTQDFLTENMAEIWTPVDWPPYIRQTPDPAIIFYLERFAGEGLGKGPHQSGCLASIHHQGMGACR